MPRAFKRPAKNLVVVVVVAATPNYLRQASPDRGKYLITHTFIYKLQRTHTHTRLPYFYKSSCMPRAVSFQRVDTVWTCVCVFLYLRTAHEAHVPLALHHVYKYIPRGNPRCARVCLSAHLSLNYEKTRKLSKRTGDMLLAPACPRGNLELLQLGSIAILAYYPPRQ